MKFLILTLMLSLWLSVAAQTPGTRVADAHGGKYFSGNKLSGETPPAFAKFLLMWVDEIGICRRDLPDSNKFVADSNGRIAVCGRVVFKGPR